jgi:hypothetical protein
VASSLVFILRHPGGRREQLTVDADRAVVGSGAHCEIRLPVEQAATEHLIVEARQGMVFGEARTLEPPPTVNGVPFTEGRLLPESIVMVGPVELSISLLHVSGAAGTKHDKGGKATPRTYLLAALAVALAFYVLSNVKKNDSAMPMPVSVPELWTTERESCPQQAKEQAVVLAGELHLTADGKRERSPFHPEDGVAAVTLYRRAGACFAVAGRQAESNEAADDAEDLRRRVIDDFRLNRLRLERSLASQDWGTARKVIRVLISFMQGRSGDYVNWLSNVDRRITIKFAGKKESAFK